MKRFRSSAFQISIVVAFLHSLNVFSIDNPHWETVIQIGSLCRYYVPSSEIGDSWKQNSFNDNSWTSDTSGIGYGDGDDNTIVSNSSSVYMRYSFTVSDPAIIERLVLDADYDDGFVAYLNGTEMARANVINPVTWNQVLAIDHEAKMYTGGQPERFVVLNSLSKSLLVAGNNTLAIEVHNATSGSTDLSSNFYFHALVKSTTQVYNQVPAWFVAPLAFSGFNLPLVVINTNGQDIPNEPKIIADMKIISNGAGKLNYIDDNPTDYNGKIGIEVRGESSQGFEQKSYSLELRKADGTNNTVKILGLPDESDFVLHGPYSDKTMMKNVLSYNLYTKMGKWAPRAKYIEVVLNEDYRGVYVLLEKIKQDKHRVDISKLDSSDVAADDISGGYILRRDKLTDLTSDEWWTSPVQQIYYQQMEYQYYDPKAIDLTDAQKNYIKDWLKGFDQIMSGTKFADPVTGYSKMIDIQSFVDMLILNEFNKGIDNYQYSCYFYKSNIKEGGKLHAGPPWDYNIAFGNIDYGFNEDIPYSYNWLYNHGGRTYWFNRLMEDESFQDSVICSWNSFRESFMSNEAIENTIDSCITVMGDGIGRQYQRYKILGNYVWPERWYPNTYDEEITNLKSWIFDRLDWMDSQWSGKCPIIPPSEITELPGNVNPLNVYPNPSDFSHVKLYLENAEINDMATVTVYNSMGQLIDKFEEPVSGESAILGLPDYSNLPVGVYFCSVSLQNSGKTYSAKIVKK